MNGFERWYNGINKILKVILALLGIGIVARIFKYIETKDASPLVGAILMVVPIVGTIIVIIDFITQICKNDFTLLYAAGSMNDFVKEEKKSDTVDAEATEVKEDSDETGEAEPEVKEEEEPDTEEKAE